MYNTIMTMNECCKQAPVLNASRHVLLPLASLKKFWSVIEEEPELVGYRDDLQGNIHVIYCDLSE